MKILQIVPVFYPAFKFGGPSVSIYIMNKALIRKGLNIDVITTTAGLENKNYKTKNDWENLDGMRVKYLPYYFKDFYGFSPYLFIEVLKLTKEYDLVHNILVWNFPILAGCLASSLHNKPCIITTSGVFYPEAIRMRSENLKKLFYFFFLKNYVEKTNLHFATMDEKSNMADFVNISGQSFIIPNGVDLNEYKNLPSKGSFKKKFSFLQDKKYILFLGRICFKKGLDLLVNSFSKLVKDYNDLFLVVAGPNDENYKSVIENKLKELGILDKVFFPGILYGKDKLSAFVDAELFVLSSYSENFALAAIEAMACYTPVIISNKVGTYKEVKDYNAGIVVDLNVDSLCNGIKTLLDNPDLCKTIAMNGRKLVENEYEINKVADMMINAYQVAIDSFKG